MQNTADSRFGVMADLPDKIDFEITLLKNHQSIARSVTTIDANNSLEGERVIVSELSSSMGTDSTRSNFSDLSNSTGGDSSHSGSEEKEGTASNDQEVSLSSDVSGNRANDLGSSKRNSDSKDATDNNEYSSETSGDRSNATSGDRDDSKTNENATSADVGASGEKNDEKTSLIKTSKRVEGMKEDGISSQQETSSDSRTVNSTTYESECSDKYVKSQTSRNYWKLDEDTGGVTQAS
jgi:hypothetical protein